MREENTTPRTYHPWRHLRCVWPDVVVEHTDDLPPDWLGATNGTRLVKLRRRQLQVERRCTLAHEIVHLERGHTGHCAPGTEAEVELEAAKRLIPWRRLLSAVRWARSEYELADELWVTDHTLQVRIQALGANELIQIARAVHDVHHTMPSEEEA